MEQSQDKEVVVTYETLYETFRREESRQELQELPAGFLGDVVTYLQEKEERFEKTKHKIDLFSTTERETLQQQLHNTRKLLRKLYERREKKIVDIAMNKSKTNSDLIDTTHMLAPEQVLFQNLVKQLDDGRQSILGNLLSLQHPAAPAVPLVKKTKTRHLKFLQEVPAFVGKELEMYGPFKPEDTAYLPEEVAGILVQQKQAMTLDEEELVTEKNKVV